MTQWHSVILIMAVAWIFHSRTLRNPVSPDFCDAIILADSIYIVLVDPFICFMQVKQNRTKLIKSNLPLHHRSKLQKLIYENKSENKRYVSNAWIDSKTTSSHCQSSFYFLDVPIKHLEHFFILDINLKYLIAFTYLISIVKFLWFCGLA